MNDMSRVIVPKSDQINADDLIGGPRTIRIAGVDIRPGTEQPVSIHFEDDNGKPWKPCKSMSRVLVAAWGADAKAYVGRSVTLYRDPKVKWGGMEVGGIRISHLSHMERDMMMALTATKGKREPYKVKVLTGEVVQHPAQASFDIDAARALIAEAPDMEALRRAWQRRDMAPHRDALKDDLEDRKAALAFEPEGRSDADMGETDAPGAVAASRINQDLEEAATIDAIGAIMARERANLDAMNDECRTSVHGTRARRLGELKGGR